MPLNVGDVVARLGFAVDDTGRKEWDRKREETKTKAREPIEQKIGWKQVDEHEVREYEAALARIKAQAARREEFRAKLGADFDETAFRQAENAMERHKRTTRSTAQGTTELNRAFSAAGGGADAFSIRIGSLGGRLDRIIRLTFALSPALYAAGGSLTALAGSATAAAGGLGALTLAGGSALSGIVALGAATVQRASVISDAYDAITKAEDDRTSSAVDAARKQVGADDQIRAAEESLADAHRNTQRATDDVTAARARARRELQDLRNAVVDTALAERTARLDLEEAVTHLAEVQADPESTRIDVQRAQIAVDDARQGLKEADQDRHRAVEDAKKGTDTLKQARQQLADATRAEARAREQVAQAQRAGTEISSKESAAAEDAREKLAKLSDAERKLLDQARDTSKTIRSVFQPATDAIFGDTARALAIVDPRLRSFRDEFKDLGDVVGDVETKFARGLAGQQGEQLERLLGDTDDVTKDLGDSLYSLFRIVLNIAEVAMPELVRETDAMSGKLDELADKSDDQFALKKRVDELIDSWKLWADLIGDVGGLLGTVLMGGKRDGDALVESLDHTVEKWDEFLESEEGQQKMREFFGDARDLLGDIFDFIRGAVQGFKDMAEFLAPIVNLLGRAAAHVLGIDDGAEGVERIGRVFGMMALLKLGGITRLLSLLLSVGAEAGAIRAALGGAGALGAAGAAGGAAATAGEVAGAGSLVSRLLPKGAGALGRKLLALDVGINLVDSKGNLIAAAINTAHDLTFGIVPKVKVQSADQRTDASIKEFADKLDAALASRDPKAIADVRREIGLAADEAREFNRQDVAKKLDDLSERSHWQPLQDELKETRRQFGLLRGYSDESMEDIKKTVKRNTERIKEALGQDTAEGRQALGHNFRLAIQEVKRQMDRGAISTRDGMQAIRGFLSQELQTYGFTLKQAKISMRGRDPVTGQLNFPDSDVTNDPSTSRPFARGGYIVGKGLVGRDTVPIGNNVVAAPGEWHGVGPAGTGVILNRHQIPVGQIAMAFARAMGGPYGTLEELATSSDAPRHLNAALLGIGWGGLPGLFRSIRRPHYLAGGGLISRLTSVANRVDRQHFPYLWGGGHQASPAPWGPFDCSGAISYVSQQAGLRIPTMTSGQFARAGKPGPGAFTIFANDGHVLSRIGQRFFGTSRTNPGGGAGWMPNPGSSYLSGFTQRHFGPEDLGAMLMGWSPIRVGKISGGGVVGRAVQRVLRLGAAAANTLGQNAVTNMGVGAGDAGDSPRPDPFVVSSFRRAQGDADANQTERLSHWEAGIVESGLRNLDFGDADSLGALQERVSIYGRAHALNPYLSSMRYLGDAIGLRPWRSSPGMLAAAVQRPRADLRGKYDLVADQAMRYMDGGGLIYAAGGAVYGQGDSYKGGKLNLKVLRRGQRGRISSFEALLAAVTELGEDYSRWDRRFGLSDEVMVDEDTGEVDVGQTQKRLRELTKLKETREKIRDKLVQARKIAQRVLATYKRIVAGLVRSRKHSKGKDRKGIDAQIKAYRNQIKAWQGTLGDAGDDLYDARTDVMEISGEYNEVATILKTGLAGQLYNPPEHDGGADGGETADAAIARANALAQDLAAAQANLAALAGPGDIGTARGGTAYASAAADLGIPGISGGPFVPTGAGQGMVLPDGTTVLPQGAQIVLVQVTAPTLVPATNEHKAAIAGAVADAFDQQGYRQQSTEQVG